MRVINTELYDDGSAWNATVEIGGVVYVASYVDNKLDVRLGQYRHNPRRPRWHMKAVREWAEKQLKSIPAEWFLMHEEMYAE